MPYYDPRNDADDEKDAANDDYPDSKDDTSDDDTSDDRDTSDDDDEKPHRVKKPPVVINKIPKPKPKEEKQQPKGTDSTPLFWLLVVGAIGWYFYND